VAAFPSVVTHTYDPARGPFRNLCDLRDDAAEAVLDAIRRSGTRTIKPDYLPRRRATEAWLAAESQRLLGATRLARPIYFFLGDFDDGADPARPRGIVLPLAALPADALTFTYPDSMTSHAFATLARHAAHRQPYHGRVYRLDEIQVAAARFGIPDERWRTDAALRHHGFIEVQLWDDRPLGPVLDRLAAAAASSAAS
jgi:hypothetical protein